MTQPQPQTINLTPTEEEKLREFAQNSLQINFHNLGLLREALTHRSYLNESRTDERQHNERLEFLGDAVLELVATEYLFATYPTRPEGDLTSFRAALVRTESLAEEAQKRNYGQYIYMSKGEERTGGRERPYILANTFESVLGAIYLDQGMDACREFIARVLLPKTDEIVSKRLDIDPKSKLQELAQEVLRFTPNYVVKGENGPDHDKTFVMSVVINGMEFGSGEGRSKQEAEQRAAAQALENWVDLYEKYSSSATITLQNK